MIHVPFSGACFPGRRAGAAGCLIRTFAPTDVQWGRPVFRAPPLEPIPIRATDTAAPVWSRPAEIAARLGADR
jgi:hypothetical protein